MDEQQVQATQPPASIPSFANGGNPWLKWVFIVCCVALLSSGTTYVVLTANQQLSPQSSQPQPKAGQPLAETPTTNPTTANWKTYTNNQYDYTVKYPPNLIPREQTSDIFLLLTVFDDPTNQEGPLRGFSIEVTKPRKLEEEATYRKWQISHLSLEGVLNESKIEKDGHEGVRLEFVTSEGGGADIILTTGSYNYTLRGKSELLDQILSTFKFTQ